MGGIGTRSRCRSERASGRFVTCHLIPANDLLPADQFTALSIPAYSRLSSLGQVDLLIAMGLFSCESVNGSLGRWDLGSEIRGGQPADWRGGCVECEA